MEITIRKAEDQDYESIYSLIEAFAAFQRSAGKVTITADQMRRDKALFQCFVAEVAEGGIIGFTTCFPAYYSWTGKAIYLDDLYVKEEYRKKGVGKRLLQTVIDHAKAADCIKVRWQVSKWNTDAIGFYRSIGAVIDEVELNCDLVLK